MIKSRHFIVGFILASLLFGGYVYAREFITAWDDHNLAALNDEIQDIRRILRNFGRGEVDTDITYIKLYNSSGTLSYVYPNSGASGVQVSTTKP